MLETLQAADFDQVFAIYNDHPDDDPGVAGSAAGNFFAVPGLDLRTDDADGFAGEILFPTEGAVFAGQLNEGLQDARFGCPRDLNGDGDTLDQLPSGQYGLLPVIIQIEWRGPNGASTFTLRTLLGNYF